LEVTSLVIIRVSLQKKVRVKNQFGSVEEVKAIMFHELIVKTENHIRDFNYQLVFVYMTLKLIKGIKINWHYFKK